MSAENRGHTLVKITNEKTPSKGNLEIHCNNCGKDFTVEAYSYKRARGHSKGCPFCKQLQAKDTPTNKLTPEQIRKRDIKKQKTKERKELLGKRYEHIKNREDLICYLKEENNAYSTFILERLDCPPPKGERKQLHHIIPTHTGGPDENWNLIPLTANDHYLAHKIRAEVYGESGDIMMIRLGVISDEKEIARVRSGDTTRKIHEKGIYEKGVSSRGGRIGGSKKTKAKDESHQGKMSLIVKKLFMKLVLFGFIEVLEQRLHLNHVKR